MKVALFSILGVMLLWTALMSYRIPRVQDNGETVLTWTTDPNPQRAPQAERFHELYPGYRLHIDPDNTDTMKVIVQSSAHIGPDIIDRVRYDLNFHIYLDAGILWDVTEHAQRMGFGLATLHETVRPLVTARDPRTLEYRQYLYPCNVGAQIVIYNKDLFDAHGVPYPPEDLTWEAYIDRASQLTIYPDDSSRVPDTFGGGGVMPLHTIWSFGGDVLNQDGTRALLAEPEAVRGMVFLHDLYYKHTVEPTPTERAGVVSQGGWGADNFLTWFSEGRVAMYIGSRWHVIQYRRHFTELREAQEQWETEHPGQPYPGRTPPRIGAAAIPRQGNGPRYSPINARSAGINKMSPHREDALLFLQYLASEPYSELINEGGDNLPGNQEFATADRLMHPDWPEEAELHRVSLESLSDGRSVTQSMFIGPVYVFRILAQAREEVIASPDLTPEAIGRVMERAAERIDLRIARNIERNPVLRDAYERLLAEGVAPIAHHEDLP